MELKELQLLSKWKSYLTKGQSAGLLYLQQLPTLSGGV